MCGIAGIVTTRDPVSASRLEAANEALRHRGPDDSGTWVDPSGTCGLGHTRLAIMDPAGGHQPLHSADGTIHAVVNGEFYGYEAIREEFARDGYRFRTESDSEILIPLYRKHGVDCLEHLRGEFALALWDERAQRLFLARDRFGIKPLFHAWHDGRLHFGSEVKALLAMGVPARWDPATVVAEERVRRNCQDTLFRGVKALSPGHSLVFENGNRSIRKYWDFDYPRRSELERPRPAQESIDEFGALLSEAVALRLRADVPVGVYLSGGIDSSTVLALMARHRSDAIDAFTVSFDRPPFDEGDVAREMAAHVGARHTVIDVGPADLAANFEGAVWHGEGPFTNDNTVAKYILSRRVQEAGLKVVLTGEGADETLGGYDYHLADVRHFESRALGPRLARWRRRLFGAGAWASPDDRQPGVVRKLGFVPHELRRGGRTAAALASLRRPGLRGADEEPHASLMRSLDDDQLEGRNPLNRSLYLSCKSLLPNSILTALGDRVEMAHGVEARLPFLDHRVVELVTRLPVELKIEPRLRSGIEKSVLREAARPLVPGAVRRRRKHVFRAPPAIAGSADPMAQLIEDTLHGSDGRQLDLYDHRKVIDFYERSKRDRARLAGHVAQHVATLAIMQRQFGLSL